MQETIQRHSGQGVRDQVEPVWWWCRQKYPWENAFKLKRKRRGRKENAGKSKEEGSLRRRHRAMPRKGGVGAEWGRRVERGCGLGISLPPHDVSVPMAWGRWGAGVGGEGRTEKGCGGSAGSEPPPAAILCSCMEPVAVGGERAKPRRVARHHGTPAPKHHPLPTIHSPS